MRGSLLSFFAVSLFAGPVQAQSDHEIKLFRPSQVNDRYRLSATGSQARQIELKSAAGETQRSQRESFTVDLSGSVRVAEVDAKGNVVVAQITVDSLVRAVGLDRREILKPGTMVTERRSGMRQDFQIDGKPVPPGLKDALDVLLSETNDSAAPSDDELMGTKERQKVGGRWPVNRERLASFFTEDRDLALAIKAEDIEGGGELTALERSGELDCMRVNVAMTILGSPRGSDLPPGIGKARLSVKVSMLLPLDTKLDGLEESTELSMTLAAPAPAQEGQQPGRIVTTWEQRSDRKMQPVR